MDEQSALIIGTSHSFGACIREENGSYEFENRVKHPNRWQDNLEKHNYKVTTFARGGCTAQHQLDAFYHYLNDNPKLYWDLIIIEGRDPESFVAYPAFPVGYIPNPENKDSTRLWMPWLAADDAETNLHIHALQARHKRIHDRKRPQFNFDVHTSDDKQITSWYKEYVLSDLHLIDVWSVNSALCSLASNYAKVVKWFSFGEIHSITQKSINLQNMFIGEYCIKNTLPSLQTNNYKHIFGAKSGTKTRCHCGHLNESGHKLLWNDILELALLEEGVL